MGLFPCVGNMPVRFTDTIDRDLNIFKNTAGVLKKVVLPDEEGARVDACTDSEIVLQKMPMCLRVEITEGRDEPLQYDLKSEYVIWSRDVAGNA